MSRVHTRHTHTHTQRQNTSDQTFRVKPCNWQWPSTARGNLSRLVDGGGAEAGGRCACQGAPTDEHVGRVKSSQSSHLTIFGMNWYIFSRLVKQMASNQSQTVLLLFLDIVYDTYHIALTNTKLSTSWLSFSFSKTAGSRGGTSRYRFQHSRCWAELSTIRWIIKLIAVKFLLWRSNIKLAPQKSNDSMGWFVVFRELSVPRSSWLWPECWRTTLLIDHCAEKLPSRDMVWKHPNANPTLQMSPSLKQRQEKNDLKCK